MLEVARDIGGEVSEARQGTEEEVKGVAKGTKVEVREVIRETWGDVLEVVTFSDTVDEMSEVAGEVREEATILKVEVREQVTDTGDEVVMGSRFNVDEVMALNKKRVETKEDVKDLGCLACRSKKRYFGPLGVNKGG